MGGARRRHAPESRPKGWGGARRSSPERRSAAPFGSSPGRTGATLRRLTLVPRLDFTHVHSYSSSAEGVALPVALRSGPETVDLLAYIDTGASNCLFEREYGEMLHLNVEAGQPKTFWTATGRVDTFGHVVSLEVAGSGSPALVYDLSRGTPWPSVRFRSRSNAHFLTFSRVGV
jgi:hypothetical protein